MDDRTASAIDAAATKLSFRLLTADESLADNLQEVAAAGCSLVERCSAASITILEDGRRRGATVAATNDIARALDQAQYDEDEGPCLYAARTGEAVRIEGDRLADAWPKFGRAALEHDVVAVLAVPLRAAGDGSVGGLNLYGREDDFDEPDQRLAEAFAAQASAVVSNALAYWGAFEQTRTITLAMESRAVIEQAKGILMSTQRCSPDEAFDLLRRASQRENRKLRDLATEIVRRATEAR